MRRKKVDPDEFRSLLESLDLQTHVGTLPSPCIGLCRVNPKTSFCEGCWRTIDEIAEWGARNEDDKRRIWQALGRRYEASLSRWQDGAEIK